MFTVRVRTSGGRRERARQTPARVAKHDLPPDLDYTDMRLVFERLVIKAAVTKGRGPLADRLDMGLRL